jgi:hypothetical protein
LLERKEASFLSAFGRRKMYFQNCEKNDTSFPPNTHKHTLYIEVQFKGLFTQGTCTS